MRICRSLFKYSYLKNKKHFLGFLFHLWKLLQILNIFKKKKIDIANVFPKLATVQGLVTPLTIQRRLKTSFDSEHVKRFQIPVKSSWEHFYHIFPSLAGEIIWKISPLLKFEVIGFLLTHGLPITSILFWITRICRSLFKSSDLKNKKHVVSFLFILWNLHKILNILKKKKIVRANVFPKLATVQGFDTPLTIQRRLKTSFYSQHVKQFQTLVKSSWERFYHIFYQLWDKIIWKRSPGLKFGIIGLFVNTWTAHYQYPLLDCENLPFPIPIMLYSKQKTFSRYFIPFIEPPSNFEHFLKKEDRHSLCISEINDRLMLVHATHYLAPSQNILRQSTC